MPALPEELWRSISGRLDAREQHVLAQVSRLHRKLWCQPRRTLHVRSPRHQWLANAGSRLWHSSGVPGSYGRGRFVVEEAEFEELTLNVVTLELHLTASQLRALCDAACLREPHVARDFAYELRSTASRDVAREAQGFLHTSSVVRLCVSHHCTTLTDDQLDAASLLLWSFPGAFNYLRGAGAALPFFDGSWTLQGPGSRIEIAWGIQQGWRCPALLNNA